MSWLNRYVFRGIGIVMVIGMITILWLAVESQTRHSAPKHERPIAIGENR